MKVSSTARKTAGITDKAADRPAPYNWIMILLILIAYLVMAFVV